MKKKNILELSKLSIAELKEIAANYLIETKDIPKQQIIYKILDKQQDINIL